MDYPALSDIDAHMSYPLGLVVSGWGSEKYKVAASQIADVGGFPVLWQGQFHLVAAVDHL